MKPFYDFGAVRENGTPVWSRSPGPIAKAARVAMNFRPVLMAPACVAVPCWHSSAGTLRGCAWSLSPAIIALDPGTPDGWRGDYVSPDSLSAYRKNPPTKNRGSPFAVLDHKSTTGSMKPVGRALGQ